jgi:hypothetical protein
MILKRFKIFMITKVYEGKIREFRTIISVMYNRLNDWIIATIKSDNAFIFDMVPLPLNFITQFLRLIYSKT